MSWFSGIKTGIKAIFGSKDGASAVMEAAKGVGGWIDEQKFTEEEKAKYSGELIDKFQVYIENTIKENTQRSITRRELALWVIRNWIIMLWASILTYAFDLPQVAEYIYKVATITELLYLVLGVGAFFFGAHIIRQTNFANPKS